MGHGRRMCYAFRDSRKTSIGYRFHLILVAPENLQFQVGMPYFDVQGEGNQAFLNPWRSTPFDETRLPQSHAVISRTIHNVTLVITRMCASRSGASAALCSMRSDCVEQQNQRPGIFAVSKIVQPTGSQDLGRYANHYSRTR